MTATEFGTTVVNTVAELVTTTQAATTKPSYSSPGGKLPGYQDQRGFYILIFTGLAILGLFGLLIFFLSCSCVGRRFSTRRRRGYQLLLDDLEQQKKTKNSNKVQGNPPGESTGISDFSPGLDQEDYPYVPDFPEYLVGLD